MPEYQVLARKYRPQTFRDVLGQEVTITTLKNAIKHRKLANAYLFCGSRGTGKTTLGRVFAKALNCQAPDPEGEPCNACSSCREITHGHSLDVLEIDGASHRGIEDIRQINETVGYAAASGKYKIYIIDEVHMLTKEAFNALLKTLEEPPEKVKFIFATTEPHKVLPTILSRCQRFNLNRIPLELIMQKLRRIADDLAISIEEEAIRMVALRAEGGLRDAESLMDQIFSFHEGHVGADSVAGILGIMTKDSLFQLDAAGKEGDYSLAFELADRVFREGKDLGHFVESLTDHFRNLLLVKMGNARQFAAFSEKEHQRYAENSRFYSQEQLLTILDLLIEGQANIKFMPSPKFALEALLLKILRTHKRVPVDFLVRKLTELESLLSGRDGLTALAEDKIVSAKITQKQEPISHKAVAPVPEGPIVHEGAKPAKEIEIPVPAPAPPIAPGVTAAAISADNNLSEDPTPSLSDLGIKKARKPAEKRSKPKEKAPVQAERQTTSEEMTPAGNESTPMAIIEKLPASKKSPAEHETLLQFAATELEGMIQKRNFK